MNFDVKSYFSVEWRASPISMSCCYRYICLKGCGRFFASARNQRNHEARCFYNTEQAHEFGDAIYEHLVYHDQEEEEASDNEVCIH